ncbi:MAG: phosphoesterase, partial [Armatimonadetes bacterium]|nr:phosphoesterase [Armatimonadota bacterium]
DPLTYSSTGFIWDAAHSRGLTFRNYGEMDYAESDPPAKFREILADWRSGTPRIRFRQKIGIDRLRRHSSPDYPGWNMEIPDVLRADRFLKDLRDFERRGAFPNLTIVYLPSDHTEGLTPGAPTPRAYMADNDLALGQVVEALSRSRFWKDMAIFVIEDDPQAGTDHVDGHRSFCLVASPYTRSRGVVSAFYNQSSVLHTIGRLLGFPPAHRGIAMAPVMDAVFRRTPDYRPYACRPITVSLEETNPPASAHVGAARALAMRSRHTDFSGPDRIDEDNHNRAIWASVRRTPYPAHLAGAHGAGLAVRGLSHARLSAATQKR